MNMYIFKIIVLNLQKNLKEKLRIVNINNFNSLVYLIINNALINIKHDLFSR